MTERPPRQVRTLTDLVCAVAPELTTELVSAEQLSLVKAVAELVPAQLSDLIGFECRLGDRNAPVDFMCRVEKSAAGSCATLLPGAATHPSWGRLRDFFHRWANPRSVLHQSVREVWLEFDLDPMADDAAVPSLFLAVAAHLARSASAGALVTETLGLIGAAGPEHPAPGRGGRVREGLLACLRRLPTEPTTVIFGVMLPRHPDFVRVCVQGLTADQLTHYLGAVGWPGRLAEVRPTLDTLAPTVNVLTLGLDVADTVRPRIGVEYMFTHRTRPDLRPRWDQPLAAVQRLGLCRPGVPDALLRFTHSSEPDGLPGSPRTHRPATWRRLNHLKVVHAPGANPEAKCYLFARYRKGGPTHEPAKTD